MIIAEPGRRTTVSFADLRKNGLWDVLMIPTVEKAFQIVIVVLANRPVIKEAVTMDELHFS